MKQILIFIIVVVGALCIAGGALPGTWFGRPVYYRPVSAFPNWGKTNE